MEYKLFLGYRIFESYNLLTIFFCFERLETTPVIAMKFLSNLSSQSIFGSFCLFFLYQFLTSLIAPFQFKHAFPNKTND